MQKKKARPYYRDLMEIEDLQVRPAQSRSELEAAFHLVYKTYLSKGLIEPSRNEMRFSIFHAFPETVTFVSVLRGTVIATATLVADTEAGLPMDKIYHEELQELRESGRQLAEVTMLADRRNNNLRRTIPMLFLLMKRLFDRTRLELEADDVCIAVHPHHADFYKKYLLFEPLGPRRLYPAVEHNPAVAKRLDFRSVKERYAARPRLWKTFFEDITPPEYRKKKKNLLREDITRLLSENPDALRQASPEAVKVLQDEYPGCPWEKLLSTHDPNL